MKTKRKAFITSVQKFLHAQELEQKRKIRVDRKALEHKHELEVNQKKLTDFMLIRALANLHGIIKCDDEFTDYLAQLFGSNRAVKISDGSGACGFPPPPIRWQNCGESELAPGLGIGTTQIMIGKEDDYEIRVSVLVLYSEYESIKNMQEERSFADGEHRQQICPVLALTARCDHFSAPNRAQVKNCQLVVVEEYTCTLLNINYSKLSEVSLDPGFITVLDKLSSTGSTFDYFLKKFGPPR
jgi:hypothetical protein